MKIHTLTISHRHGRDVTAHASYAEAHATLADFAREWWTHEGLAGEPPTDDAEAIAYYFERMDDESADIDECELALPDAIRAPVLLDRTGAADGDVIGIDADGSVINEHERGEPYNCGESLFEFGACHGEPDPLHDLTEKEAKALLAALYSRIWPEARHA